MHARDLNLKLWIYGKGDVRWLWYDAMEMMAVRAVSQQWGVPNGISLETPLTPHICQHHPSPAHFIPFNYLSENASSGTANLRVYVGPGSHWCVPLLGRCITLVGWLKLVPLSHVCCKRYTSVPTVECVCLNEKPIMRKGRFLCWCAVKECVCVWASKIVSAAKYEVCLTVEPVRESTTWICDMVRCSGGALKRCEVA